MPSDFDFTMSLGFRHPDVDPASITRSLALEPEHGWRRGDERRDLEGAALAGSRRESYWICEFASNAALEGKGVELEAELTRLLHLLRRSMSFMQQLHHSGGAAELFISVYTRREFRLSLLAEEASLLGRMGVALTLEVRPQAMSAMNAALS